MRHLRTLADWYVADNGVRLGIDHCNLVRVLQAHIHPGAVARGPEAMGQRTGRNTTDLGEVLRAEDLHLIQTADSDVGKLTRFSPREINVVSDRSGLYCL